jgi:ATP-dependent helicase HrpB
MTLGQDLPVYEALPALKAALRDGRGAVLEAPPGAGKTTLVPLALLNEPWLHGQTILMLEPRRVAARAAAHRMAQLLGESVGETSGYRIRLEAKIGPRTRIEVVTEALLTRRLQNDPSLDGTGLVIFDEFHERSLDSDLGLALALECREALQPDLRLLVMSATLDGERVARLLGGAAVIRSEGRQFPVDVVHLPRPEQRALATAVADAVRRAIKETQGSILVFLPGEGEIRAVERALADGAPPQHAVVPLYGNMPFEAQIRAVASPSGGERRIVLATAIAETSLTIPDVRAVVDAGLSRFPRFDPATGMTRLVTAPVSLATAEQRRGRAGRVAPGRCYRLWSAESHRALPAFAPPEMAVADLAPLALDLAAWGDSDPAAYAFLDPPPAAAYAQAQELLRELEALDASNRITAHGRAVNALGMHPRLAHMILAGAAHGDGPTACAVAALLSERDVMRPDRDRPDADLRTRLGAMAGERDAGIDRSALARARDNARAWGRQARIAQGPVEAERAGALLALAYPERVAQRRGPRGSYRLRSGRGALLAETDALAGQDLLAVGAIDQRQDNARIFLAAPLARDDLEVLFGDQVETSEEIGWDARSRSVNAQRIRRLGALVLDQRRLEGVAPDRLASAVLDGLRQTGLDALPWTPHLRQLQARVAFLRQQGDPYPALLPDLSDDALAASLSEWLVPYLDGVTRADQFGRIDLHGALTTLIGWEGMRLLDADAPTHIAVPTGSRIEIGYDSGEPVLAVRLQEMFGATTTPTIARGRVPLTLHLLSPARRPVQVTRDLGGFWRGSYADVRKDLRGRYPKHKWPDDPTVAAPTTRTKRTGERD